MSARRARCVAGSARAALCLCWPFSRTQLARVRDANVPKSRITELEASPLQFPRTCCLMVVDEPRGRGLFCVQVETPAQSRQGH